MFTFFANLTFKKPPFPCYPSVFLVSVCLELTHGTLNPSWVVGDVSVVIVTWVFDELTGGYAFNLRKLGWILCL